MLGAPQELHVPFGGSTPGSSQIKDYKRAIGDELKHYFQSNEGTVKLHGILWEGGKAMI